MKFSREISAKDSILMPSDMQDILGQFLEQLNLEYPVTIKLYWTPVLPLWHQIRNEVWDYRGPSHVAAFIRSMWDGDPLPPIIVRGDEFYDGRHRLWAAKVLGIDYLEAIDLNNI